MQRHINKAEPERQRLGPAPGGPRKAHNRKNAIEDNEEEEEEEEEEDVVELSFEHYRRRAPKLGCPASQLKVHNARLKYVPPHLPKPRLQVKLLMTACAPLPGSNLTTTSQPFCPVPRPLALEPLRL